MQFTIKNISESMSTTIGNCLRRTLYTELSSWCIESINLTHEFGTIAGIAEDIPQIILNLKQVNIAEVVDAENVYLDIAGPCTVRAKDIAGIVCANPDLEICNIATGAQINWKFTVAKAKGYVAAKTPEPQKLYIDMIGTVVTKVNYEYKDNDLILTVETNGTMTPRVALNAAVSEINKYLTIAEIDDFKEMQWSIENLDLEVRTLNCLRYAGIETIEQLCEKTADELMQIKNFGVGTLEDVIKKLNRCGKGLKS